MCQSESSDDTIGDSVAEEMSNLGIVNDDTQVYGDESLSSSPGVETACVFPNNIGKGMHVF